MSVGIDASGNLYSYSKEAVEKSAISKYSSKKSSGSSSSSRSSSSSKRRAAAEKAAAAKLAAEKAAANKLAALKASSEKAAANKLKLLGYQGISTSSGTKYTTIKQKQSAKDIYNNQQRQKQLIALKKSKTSIVPLSQKTGTYNLISDPVLRNNINKEKARLDAGVKSGKLTLSEAQKIYDSYKNARIIEYNKKTTEKEYGILESVTTPDKNQYLSIAEKKISDALNKLETKRFRTKGNSLNQITIGLGELGFGIIEGGLSTIRGIKELPKTMVTFLKNPALILQIPKNVIASSKTVGDTLRISPTRTVARIGTEAFLMSGTGNVTKVVKKISNSSFNKFAKVIGKNKIVKNNKLIVIAKGGSSAGIEMELGTVSSLKKTLAEQTKLAGTTRPLVTTAQANRLLSFWDKSKKIRKPLPYELELPTKYKKLLAKFDNRTLTKTEFTTLEKYLQSKYSSGLLERSLYVDPTGSLRTSRLQIIKDIPTASLRDILKGNFQLFPKTGKPQIIFFRNVVVESFPKTKIFKSILKKFRQNKPLTQNELLELVKFQTKKSGKFKPIGSTTYRGGIEPELTLAGDELIKTVKKRGFTVINGKRVSIVEAKVIKGSRELNTLLAKLKTTGSLAKAELAKLKKLFKKETGTVFDTRQRRLLSKKPVIRLKMASKIKRLSRVTRNGVTKKAIRRNIPTTRTTPKKTTPTRKTTTRTTPKKTTPTRKTTSSRIARPIKKTKKLIYSKKTTSNVLTKRLSKPVMTYKVYVKKRGKNVLLGQKLTQTDAKNLLAYDVDNTLLRSAVIKPQSKLKIVTRLPGKYSGAFSQRQSKFRQYKIQQKNKKNIKGYIEKKKYAADTRKEKKQLIRARKKKTSIKKKTKSKRKKK